MNNVNDHQKDNENQILPVDLEVYRQKLFALLNESGETLQTEWERMDPCEEFAFCLETNGKEKADEIVNQLSKILNQPVSFFIGNTDTYFCSDTFLSLVSQHNSSEIKSNLEKTFQFEFSDNTSTGYLQLFSHSDEDMHIYLQRQNLDFNSTLVWIVGPFRFSSNDMQGLEKAGSGNFFLLKEVVEKLTVLSEEKSREIRKNAQLLIKNFSDTLHIFYQFEKGKQFQKSAVDRLILRDLEFQSLAQGFEGFMIHLNGVGEISALYGKDMVDWQDQLVDCVGKSYEEFFDLEKMLHKQMMQKALEGEIQRYQYPFEIDDEKLFFKAEMLPYKNLDGKITGVLSLHRKAVSENTKIFENTIHKVDFEGFVSRFNDMVFRISIPDGVYEYINPVIEKLFGYKPQELYDNPLFIRKILHPDDVNTFEKQWVDLQNGRIPDRLEFRIIDKEGRERWISQSNTLVYDREGKLTALEGVCTEITHKKNTEASLRKSEEKFRLLADNAEEGILLLDTKGTILEINKRAVEIAGMTHEELAGKNVIEIVKHVKFDIKRVLAQIRHVARGEELINNEIMITNRKGQKLIIKGNLNPIRQDNKVIGISLILRDITKQKEAEEELKRSEERFRTVVQQSPISIELYDLDGFQIDLDSPYSQFDDQRMLSNKPRFNILDDTYSKQLDLYKAVKSVFDGQQSQVHEWTMDPSKSGFSGQIRHMRTTIYPIRNFIKEVINVVLAHEDITDIKRKQLELLEKEKNYRFLVEQSPYGIAIHRNGILAYLNPAALKMLKINDPDQVINKTIFSFVPRTYTNIVMENMEKIRQGIDVEYPQEQQFLRLDNTLMDVEIYSTRMDYEGSTASYVIFNDITEKKKAERSIIENARYLEVIFNTLPVGITITEDRRLTYVNPAFCKMTGYSAEELVGQNARILYQTDELYEFVGEQEKNMISKHQISMLDIEILDKNKNSFPVFMQASALYPDDFSKGILTTVVDVSEIRQTKSALEESNRMLNLILETIPLRIVWKDLDLRYMGANRKFLEDAGVENVEDLIGKTDFDTKWRPAAERIQAADREVIQSGEPSIPIDIQSTIKKDVVWRMHSRVPLRDENGQIMGLLGMYEDYTEQKKLEMEKENLQKLLADILDSMSARIISVDESCTISHWNQIAIDDLGVKKEDAIGKDLFELIPDLKSQSDEIRDAIKNAKIIKNNRLITKQDGEDRIFDISVFPVATEGINHGVIQMDDITERLKIEEMIIQTGKMMSLGGLAAGMAHEINNPLAGMIQNIQVIQNRLSSTFNKNQKVAEEIGVSMEDIEKYVSARELDKMMNMILQSGQRAAKIVENMLNFSRKSKADFGLNDLKKIVNETLELAKNDYELKKYYDFRTIDIVKEFPDDLPKVWCEAPKIQQVLFNLLKNSSQAIQSEVPPKEKRSISIALSSTQNDIVIKLGDNGPGMPEHIRKRVFEPFFTTKQAASGTGLGLSMSYFIITEQHKGTMSVESEVGKGTTFTITIPRTGRDDE